MTPRPKISHAQAIDDQTLLIKSSNEEVKKYDIGPLLNRPIFAPLEQPGFFRNFKVEPGGYGLSWNKEVDISEYELWKNGVAVEQTVLAE